jgi:hypothetical protein
VEGPEHHGHAHHGTGIRWVDISLGLAALFTSIVSLGVAVEHGRDMSKLVQANSLPYVQISKSDLAADGRTEVTRLTIENQGVGPARIADVRITVDGKPVPDLNTLIDHCCAPGFLIRRTDREFAGIRYGEVVKSTALDRMVRPGQSIDMISWPLTATNQGPAQALVREIGRRVQVSICYCSVFDECWTRAFSADPKPTPVKSCPADRVPYTD